MEEQNRRLDLDAPLLSVRRFASEPESEPNPSVKANGNPNRRRSTLPFYKSDLKSGPVRSPGVVPFVWEQTPGYPKHRARTDRILIETEPINPLDAEDDDGQRDNEEEEEEEEKFSDALETLSRTESLFMNCSISGLSETPGKMEASRSFSTDPQVRNFMMGRFLPAAKSVATETPHSSLRKPATTLVQARKPRKMVERDENGEQRRVRFPNGANFALEEEGTSCSYDEDEDEEECYHNNGHFFLKGCGLLPKFCLLNPVPGIKASGQRLRANSVRRVRGARAEEEGLFCLWNPPGSGQSLLQNSVRRVDGAQVQKMQPKSLGRSKEEYLWEAVYRHKLINGNTPAREEDGSKLTESNHLTYLSDSLSTDGSSQYHSNTSAVTSHRNEPSQSPFHEGKGFLGVPKRGKNNSRTDNSDSFDKDGENCWVMTPHHSSQCGSGSLSLAVERTLHVDTLHMPETSISKLSSQDTSSDDKDKTGSANKYSELGILSHESDENLLKNCDKNAMQSNVTEVVDNRQEVSPESSFHEAVDEKHGFKPSDKDDSGVPLKENNQVKNDVDPMISLLSPPLPNTPSESWLSRALPSVSSKKPSAKSLDVYLQARKQPCISTLIVPKKEIHFRPPKAQRGQIRFADMLAEPLSPQSEI